MRGLDFGVEPDDREIGIVLDGAANGLFYRKRNRCVGRLRGLLR